MFIEPNQWIKIHLSEIGLLTQKKKLLSEVEKKKF